jgi:hypothetical protein
LIRTIRVGYRSAKGAKYDSQGQARAKRSASPLESNNKHIAALKGRHITNAYFGLSGLGLV